MRPECLFFNCSVKSVTQKMETYFFRLHLESNNCWRRKKRLGGTTIQNEPIPNESITFHDKKAVRIECLSGGEQPTETFFGWNTLLIEILFQSWWISYRRRREQYWRKDGFVLRNSRFIANPNYFLQYGGVCCDR